MDKNYDKEFQIIYITLQDIKFQCNRINSNSWDLALDLSNFAVSFIPITSAEINSAYKNLNEYFNITK